MLPSLIVGEEDQAGLARIVRDVGLAEELAQDALVVELNRAVALAMAFGPAAGLDLIDTLALEPSLKAYHLLPSARGDFLFKLGRFIEAQPEFERAASLTQNASERNLLIERARVRRWLSSIRATVTKAERFALCTQSMSIVELR